jgi:photosystem II stability/assembly factor-like uncharacterized protein
LVAQQATKGVWEPVNYKGDLQFTDVFFVTPEEGWVSGYAGPSQGGVILHTKDAGLTWAIQFGDPESSDREILRLFFLDATHGWATRPGGARHTLLRTTDGESWEEAGTLPGTDDFVFIDPNVGFSTSHDEIQRTTDGGRHWTTVAKCQVTVEVDGLTHQDSCSPWAIHFPTPQIGYAVGKGSSSYIALLRTRDGGATWTASAVPAEDGAERVFFTSEQTGFVRVGNGKLYRTDDGGDSWRALPASAPRKILFADPEVGWSMRYRSMMFTANGGRSWSTREIGFPTMVNAFSLPRRDRGYAVGDHGMIYRYSLVSAGAAAAGSLPAPAMPAFDSTVLDSMSAIGAVVRQLSQAVDAVPDTSPASSRASASAPASSPDDSSGATVTPSGTPNGASAFVTRCCARSLPKLRLALVAVSSLVPQFVERFRNVNLIQVGWRMLSELPGRVRAVSAAYRDFSHAQDKQTAKTAVAQLSAAVDSLTTAARSTLQAR